MFFIGRYKFKTFNIIIIKKKKIIYRKAYLYMFKHCDIPNIRDKKSNIVLKFYKK